MADHPLLVAMRPVASALGALLVKPRRMIEGDIPLEWEGEVVGGLRLPDLTEELSITISRIEQNLGAALAQLSREQKQQAVRLLEDRGAFALRGAIEDVADAMGVSRITNYNYLPAIRDTPDRITSPR